LEEAIPEQSIKEAFMRREDIKDLPLDEQEARWAQHLPRVRDTMKFFEGMEGIVLKL
jgi:hypothetical protein